MIIIGGSVSQLGHCPVAAPRSMLRVVARNGYEHVAVLQALPLRQGKLPKAVI
jgi:hypothetical protein